MGHGVRCPNPNYCNPLGGTCPAGADTINKTIMRDYGLRRLGDRDHRAVSERSPARGATPISCTIPNNTNAGVGGRQLTVTRAGGGSTVTGMTVQFGLRGNGGNQGQVVQVMPGAGRHPGPPSTRRGRTTSSWSTRHLQRDGGHVEADPAPGLGRGLDQDQRPQAAGREAGRLARVWSRPGHQRSDRPPARPGGWPSAASSRSPSSTRRAPGSWCSRSAGGNSRFGLGRNQGARVDGFTITGADTGGGIIVNGYASYLDISNNRVANNSGNFSGGIRVGHPLLLNAGPGRLRGRP